MMIPIKIQCGCGQRYAFDVEPVNGRMTSPVACPACGADGTITANAIIARNVQPQTAAAPEPAVRLHVATPASTIQPTSSAPALRRGVPLAGHVDPAKAEVEARSKIFWGDPPKDVVQFLMMQGFPHEDATISVRAMFQERVIALQGIGIKKIVTGIALMTVPVVAILIFAHFHVAFITLLVLAIAVGLWGAWMFLRGSIMVLVPKLETGDVSSK
jgi:hypothetical protein